VKKGGETRERNLVKMNRKVRKQTHTTLAMYLPRGSQAMPTTLRQEEGEEEGGEAQARERMSNRNRTGKREEQTDRDHFRGVSCIDAICSFLEISQTMMLPSTPQEANLQNKETHTNRGRKIPAQK
jgi:hypothetical protein